MNLENMREEGAYDPVGTIRVCQQFGTIAVYIRVGENRWRAIYVDPKHNEFLSPVHDLTDSVATSHPVVFTPKTVV